MQFCPDQQQLLFIRDKIMSTTEDEAEEAEPFCTSIGTNESQTTNINSNPTSPASAAPEPSKLTTFDEDFDFQRFTLISQHNFPLLQLQSHQQPKQQKIPQMQIQLQQQQQIQQLQNLINFQNSGSQDYGQRGILQGQSSGDY